MNKEEFEAISEGEALHFLDPHQIPWDVPCSARSFNEFFHILQYKWFRAVIDASENVGAYLDVACGTGYGTAMVGSSTCITHTVGVDLNQGHLLHAKANFPHINFMNADCEQLEEKLPESSFAFITSGQTIEHLIDPVQFIYGITRLLQSNGLFLLMSPTHNSNPIALKESNPWHIFEYDYQSIKKLLNFFFDDIRFVGSLPFQEIFNDLTALGGIGIQMPKADAVFCAKPKKYISHDALALFRKEYLEQLYKTIILSIQSRMVEARRSRHFLKDVYGLIDLERGFYNSELDKVWTMNYSRFTIKPSSQGRSIKLFFLSSVVAPYDQEVCFMWGKNKKKYILNTMHKTDSILLTNLSDSVRIEVYVTPTFCPREYGGHDIRKLGIALYRLIEI